MFPVKKNRPISVKCAARQSVNAITTLGMLNLGGAGVRNRREIRERNEMKKAAGWGQLVRMALSCFEATD